MISNQQDIVFRESRPHDAAQLTDLWCTVFGDPPELVSAFLSLLPEMGSGYVAKCSGRILGAAYLVHGFSLLQPGKPTLRCGYLYAVAVERAVRGFGLGAALSRGAADLGRLRGADFICTLPAEDSLYRWYADVLTLTYQSTRRVFFTNSLPQAHPISSFEYLMRREELLNSLPHVLPNRAAMEFEATLCRICGGGLYAWENMIFCAYRENGGWVIPELLPSSAADHFPSLSVETRPYLCSDRPIPEGVVWNLTFD